MKTIFYVIIGDSHYAGCRTDEFIESFKLFHPDIELAIFREEAIRRIFSQHYGMNYMNAKAAFAQQLWGEYELIVNIDADHLIFYRMNEILEGDYDVAGVAQYNLLCNASLIVSDEQNAHTVVPCDKYLEAGLIAGKHYFWSVYQWNNMKHGLKWRHREQDVYNLMLQFVPLNVKVLDGDHPNMPNHARWYGTSVFGRERDIVIQNDQIMLHGKPLITYHFSKLLNPKPHPRELFSSQVCDWIYSKVVTGKTPSPVKVVDGVYWY